MSLPWMCPRLSASHEARAPAIERPLFMRPGALLDRVGNNLQLGRELDEASLRILDHEEEIVAGAMSPRSPPQRRAARRHRVRPVADVVPARRLIGMMVGTRLRCAEHGEAVML